MEYIQLTFEFIGEHVPEIIAFCALGFTGWSANAQRRHNVLSVRPHLVSFSTALIRDNIGTVKLELSNTGLGPAFFTEFKAFLNGEPCDYNEAVDSVTNGWKCKRTLTRYDKGHSMRAGDISDLFLFEFPCTNKDEMAAAMEKFKPLSLSIGYKCAYGKPQSYNTWVGPNWD